MTRKTLVIFDCDGVLVDSEPLAAQAMAQEIRSLGLAVTEQQVDEQFRGRSLNDCIHLLETQLGHSLEESFLPRLNERTFAAFRAELQAVEGVAEAASVLLNADCTLCVASSGSYEKMALTLGTTGLAKLFSRRFSASDVMRGKPAPDLFMHAMSEMGFSPQDSTVVEDSVVGVQAARAAGVNVLGYAGAGNTEELRRAGSTPFHSMSQLPQLLGVS